MEHPRRSAQMENSPVSLGSSLRADINLTNQLSALLDRAHDDAVIRQLSLDDSLSAEHILLRVLTPDSGTSTTSSFAHFQQSQQALTSVGYRVIGFGQCGLVLERPGQKYVLKIAKPSYEDTLWDDFEAHFNVRRAFDLEQNKNIECRVPQLFSYVSKDNQKWWQENIPFFPAVHESVPLPAMALVSQRILPLPKVGRQALIDKYCPEPSRALAALNDKNRDCLARVYLGRRRLLDTLSANFTLRNFNLHLDQMVELKLPVKYFASAMGEALAVIHWSAHVDGYDIEFVLGSEGDTTYSHGLSVSIRPEFTPQRLATMQRHTDIESLMTVNFKRRTIRLWVLDFNLCHIWDEMAALNNPEGLFSHLVTSFFENDPYYPLPLMEHDLDQELWEIFRAKYLEKAGLILHESNADSRLANLPPKFIDGCVLRERENLLQGCGHGYRQTK
ncbi:zinc finger protein-domain-containing protein [Penicillium macrosclerotiorum]|uniref:zinc finger protein-domain-containing protein n=1 Tax=Penicillium macrosclerotiorum TaxID=303699 RepID=UPI00254905F8|nr:zinc finger protein-domain-containing protein [Penicillium macrosclerotiorum]KAJ5688903.1 zinc finger protein-domain-containing protein [Penicillium macrosclerotiorum]